MEKKTFTLQKKLCDIATSVIYNLPLLKFISMRMFTPFHTYAPKDQYTQ